MIRAALVALLALTGGARAAEGEAPVVKFSPPAETDYPEGPLGEEVRLGERLLRETRAALPENARNGLNCTSCHLKGGRTPFAAPWVGLSSAFPAYHPRSGRVITLTDRVNFCFERSLNGKPLDPSSHEMTAIVAYVSWLSRGVPAGASVKGRGFATIDTKHAPDAAAGKELFRLRCVKCHGLDGAGRDAPDGAYAYPALWGPRSFTDGAGMARRNTAAAFIRRNMPQGEEGSLSDEQALDLAEYFTKQPRPEFARKKDDWPKGGRPADARD